MADDQLSPADAAVVAWAIHQSAIAGCDVRMHEGKDYPCSDCLRDVEGEFSDLVALVVAARAETARVTGALAVADSALFVALHTATDLVLATNALAARTRERDALMNTLKEIGSGQGTNAGYLSGLARAALRAAHDDDSHSVSLADAVANRLGLTPDQREQFDKLREEWGRSLKPLSDALRESKTITQEDLTIRDPNSTEAALRAAGGGQ